MGEQKFFKGKDGKVHPITPKKGGGALVAAIALVGGMMGVGGGIGGSGLADTTADSVAGQSFSAKTNASRTDASKGRSDQAWARIGWKALKKKAERALQCAANSYGQVQHFFLRKPCRSLDRTLLLIGDGHGNTIVLAIAWVHMNSASDAEALKSLADTDGTGNVSPIGGPALGLAGVRFTGSHYHSERRGSLTVIAEAAPGAGQPNPTVMDAAAQIATALPPP